MALGFSLLVAWMVPPTEPRPAAPNWRANFKPVAPPAPVDFAGLAPTTQSMSAYPVERAAYAGDTTGEAQVLVYRGSSADEESQPVADRAVERDATPDTATSNDRGVYFRDRSQLSFRDLPEDNDPGAQGRDDMGPPDQSGPGEAAAQDY